MKEQDQHQEMEQEMVERTKRLIAETTSGDRLSNICEFFLGWFERYDEIRERESGEQLAGPNARVGEPLSLIHI